MANRKQRAAAKEKALQVDTDGVELLGEAVARKINAPWTRHGLAAMEFQGQITKSLPADGRPGFDDFANDLKRRADKVGTGNLELAVQLLTNQAITLDAIFTEMARRSGLNMGEYIEAAERYMRLALKAQAQSRATIEALDKLANGREQTVRHVHVDNRGGQAVIAESVTAGGQGNGKIDDQSYGPATVAAGVGSALLGADSCENGVPVSSREGEAAMQDARRHKSGSA